ncbi:MAG TPA: hypothetical protein VFE61_29120 [Candidatus Sulfotelmatobacter sp.]|nr:hypothetical protein [Candidatus Sulfotelmatobacter sp.]
MSLLIRQHAVYVLSVMLFGITGIGVSQEANVMMATGPMVGGAAFGPAQIGVVTTRGMAIPLQENTEIVKNQPYQAQAVTEVKQTLADGTHITQTTTATVARDSDGRTVRIQKLSTIGPWKSASNSSQADAPTLTTIFDPVAQTHTDYNSDSNVAHVLAMPALPAKAQATGATNGFAVTSAGPGGGGPGNVTFAFKARAEAGEAPNGDVKTESMGDKAIDSIPVTGTRTTNTIPAGTIGNDKDIVITRETWYSPDLKLVLQTTQTDPRFGETTYSLTNVERSEPDLTMFQIPAGYTVEKVPVTVQPR